MKRWQCVHSKTLVYRSGLEDRQRSLLQVDRMRNNKNRLKRIQPLIGDGQAADLFYARLRHRHTVSVCANCPQTQHQFVLVPPRYYTIALPAQHSTTQTATPHSSLSPLLSSFPTSPTPQPSLPHLPIRSTTPRYLTLCFHLIYRAHRAIIHSFSLLILSLSTARVLAPSVP